MKNKFYLIILSAIVFGFMGFFVVKDLYFENVSIEQNNEQSENISDDTLNGSAQLAAESSLNSNLYLVLANFAKNNESLASPDCPTGFSSLYQDSFVQYQNQENVVGGIYDATYMNYYARNILQGIDMSLRFRVYKNTANSTCSYVGYQYIAYTTIAIPFYCVGDCSSCSDATSVSVAYTICERDSSVDTIQGGQASAPEITNLTVTRDAYCETPYYGTIDISATINNGGENVDLELYVNDVLVDTATGVTNTYSLSNHLVPEDTTYPVRVEVVNSAGSDSETHSGVYVGTILGGGHNEADCTSAGGTVYSIEPGKRICKIPVSWSGGASGSGCPSYGTTCVTGWTGYYNWSTTTTWPHYCNPGYHSWANTSRECCVYAVQSWAYANTTERGCY